MQYPLDLTTAKKNEVSGFLYFPSCPFTPEHKARFLRVFEETGDQVRAMDTIGYSKKVLDAHLAIDVSFKDAFDNTEAKMKARMEGAMYQRGLEERGTVDRTNWLKANWPEKYGTKTVVEYNGKGKSKLDDLFDKAIEGEVVTEQLEDKSGSEEA